MKKRLEKPTPEAKALSLFLMAFKKIDPVYKEKSKWINKRWDMVQSRELSKTAYQEEVQKMLTSYGGYSEVLAKTVKHYIKATGEWTLKGDDKYCHDARKVADDILKK